MMKILKYAVVAVVMMGPLGASSIPAKAATAHNSQAGGFGQSKNANASTVNSRRVKHDAKHRRM